MTASSQKRARKQEVPSTEQVGGTVEALHRPRKRRDQEVIDAAAKVFYERGFADASVQDVADELGILKGSLYHYIETKEDSAVPAARGTARRGAGDPRGGRGG